MFGIRHNGCQFSTCNDRTANKPLPSGLTTPLRRLQADALLTGDDAPKLGELSIKFVWWHFGAPFPAGVR
jgi:hypothetical protein